jgi:hypothetical protein
MFAHMALYAAYNAWPYLGLDEPSLLGHIAHRLNPSPCNRLSPGADVDLERPPT